MAFIQDPRMRQRWNQISHTTEAVTENAAAGIWTFGHRYINPCLESLGQAVDSCMGPCIGDREERARRARERERGARRTRAEYSFDFYDDWDEYGDYYDDGSGGGGSGIIGSGSGGGWSWGPMSEDWDRLLAGTGASKRHHSADAVEVDQPRRKRGMSYGTRGPRRKASADEDPNVIPRTAPLGFLGRLPFKLVGSLRYKPSAANLRDHPYGDNGLGRGGAEEHEPLLGSGSDGNGTQERNTRGSGKRSRSNTTESGDTSSSYRSRGDLFPSDGEGDEDAVPLDEEEFTVALDRVDDRSSNKTRSSKGKRRADTGDKGLSRTGSRTTISSAHTPDEHRSAVSLASTSFPDYDDASPIPIPSLDELQEEEERVQREEDEDIERRRRAASQLALQRGLSQDNLPGLSDTFQETTIEEENPPTVTGTDVYEAEDQPVTQQVPKLSTPPPLAQQPTSEEVVSTGNTDIKKIRDRATGDQKEVTREFIPARLPHFG